MKVVRIAAVAAFGIALAAFAGVGRPDPAEGADPATEERTVTVSGFGAVKTVPDQAEWSFGVQTQARTARDAMRLNADDTRRVISALKAAGIPAEDIRTEHVSLYPQMSSEGLEIVSFQASNSVHVTAPLARAGSLVDTATEAGANQVYGPTLTRSNTDQLYDQAMAFAFDQARAKAGSLAAKAGVSLGKVMTISEAGGSPQPIFADSATKLAESAAPPVEPGQEEIQATLLVTFAVS